MAGGIRLRHPTLKSGLYLVKHYRRYKYPMACPTCHTIHERKTYHLNLDEAGSVIVSPVVFERLKEIGLAGLEIENEVLNPPPLVVSAPVIEKVSRALTPGMREH